MFFKKTIAKSYDGVSDVFGYDNSKTNEWLTIKMQQSIGELRKKKKRQKRQDKR